MIVVGVNQNLLTVWFSKVSFFESWRQNVFENVAKCLKEAYFRKILLILLAAVPNLSQKENIFEICSIIFNRITVIDIIPFITYTIKFRNIVILVISTQSRPTIQGEYSLVSSPTRDQISTLARQVLISRCALQQLHYTIFERSFRLNPVPPSTGRMFFSYTNTKVTCSSPTRDQITTSTVARQSVGVHSSRIVIIVQFRLLQR